MQKRQNLPMKPSLTLNLRYKVPTRSLLKPLEMSRSIVLGSEVILQIREVTRVHFAMLKRMRKVFMKCITIFSTPSIKWFLIVFWQRIAVKKKMF